MPRTHFSSARDTTTDASTANSTRPSFLFYCSQIALFRGEEKVSTNVLWMCLTWVDAWRACCLFFFFHSKTHSSIYLHMVTYLQGPDTHLLIPRHELERKFNTMLYPHGKLLPKPLLTRQCTFSPALYMIRLQYKKESEWNRVRVAREEDILLFTTTSSLIDYLLQNCLTSLHTTLPGPASNLM